MGRRKRLIREWERVHERSRLRRMLNPTSVSASQWDISFLRDITKIPARTCRKCGRKHTKEEYDESRFCRNCGTFLFG